MWIKEFADKPKKESTNGLKIDHGEKWKLGVTEQWEVEHIFRANNEKSPKKSFLPAEGLELTAASLTLNCELVDERVTGPRYCNFPEQLTTVVCASSARTPAKRKEKF